MIALRDMEPLVMEPHPTSVLVYIKQFNQANNTAMETRTIQIGTWSFLGFNNDTTLIISNHSLRLRGGTPYPSNDKSFNEIPYLTNMRFLWNGLPQIDFVRRIMYPLNNGLGSVTLNGDTLLSTARRTDN